MIDRTLAEAAVNSEPAFVAEDGAAEESHVRRAPALTRRMGALLADKLFNIQPPSLPLLGGKLC